MKTRSLDATSLVCFQCMMGKQPKKSGSAIRNYLNRWNDFSTSWANPLNSVAIKDIQLDWIQNVRLHKGIGKNETYERHIAGESGETSFASSWRDCEIMFHVAPLMPLRENDKQQVHRKRYIGNGM